MFYYIQSNDANVWKPAMDSQIETLISCIESQSDVKFVITDPISGKSFNSVCKFSNDHCYFHNLPVVNSRKRLKISPISYIISEKGKKT